MIWKFACGKYVEEQLILFLLVPFLHQGMSRMTEYIAIEDDNVMTHFLQVLTIG